MLLTLQTLNNSITAVDFRLEKHVMYDFGFAPDEKDTPTIYRHWSPFSEKYTGGDALVTALDDGWKLQGVVFRQEFWLAGVRRVCLYHVELVRNGETTRMVVVQNPYVTRLLFGSDAQVVLINQRKATSFDPLS